MALRFYLVLDGQIEADFTTFPPAGKLKDTFAASCN